MHKKENDKKPVGSIGNEDLTLVNGRAILFKSGIGAQTIPVLILEKLTQPLIWPNIHTWTGSRQKSSTSQKC